MKVFWYQTNLDDPGSAYQLNSSPAVTKLNGIRNHLWHLMKTNQILGPIFRFCYYDSKACLRICFNKSPKWAWHDQLVGLDLQITASLVVKRVGLGVRWLWVRIMALRMVIVRMTWENVSEMRSPDLAQKKCQVYSCLLPSSLPLPTKVKEPSSGPSRSLWEWILLRLTPGQSSEYVSARESTFSTGSLHLFDVD